MGSETAERQEALTALNDAFACMREGEAIARIYSLGFNEQPACWPKHEQRVFAELHLSGKWRETMRGLKNAHKLLAAALSSAGEEGK